jgi:hypothetical protein
MDEDDEDSPPVPAKPSMVPSWIMLGFALGALFVWALPRRPEAPVREPVAPTPTPLVRRFSTVEAVFEQWGQYASWSDNTTQIALWSGETNSFSECYEAVRVGEAVYFRSIPALTRPILTHGILIDGCPLQFTETAAQHEQWLAQVRDENGRQFVKGVREAFGPDPVPSPVPTP